MGEQEGQERLSHRLGNGLLFIVSALWQGLLFIFHIFDGLLIWIEKRRKGILFLVALVIVGICLIWIYENPLKSLLLSSLFFLF